MPRRPREWPDPTPLPDPYRMVVVNFKRGDRWIERTCRFHGFFQHHTVETGELVPYPVAVVELADGLTESVCIEDIRFTTGLMDTDTEAPDEE